MRLDLDHWLSPKIHGEVGKSYYANLDRKKARPEMLISEGHSQTSVGHSTLTGFRLFATLHVLEVPGSIAFREFFSMISKL